MNILNIRSLVLVQGTFSAIFHDNRLAHLAITVLHSERQTFEVALNVLM